MGRPWGRSLRDASSRRCRGRRRWRVVAGAIGALALTLTLTLIPLATAPARAAAPPPAPPNLASRLPAAPATALWSTLKGPLARLRPAEWWATSLAGDTLVAAPGGALSTELLNHDDTPDTVLGLDVRTGAQRWIDEHKGWRLETVTASAPDGIAAVLWVTDPTTVFNETRVFTYALSVLDLRTGKVRWTRQAIGRGRDGGRVVVVDHEVVALAGSRASAFTPSGRLLWRDLPPAGCGWRIDDLGVTGGEITLASAAVLPYACDDSGVVAGIARLSPATGATIWERGLPGAEFPTIGALVQAGPTVAVEGYGLPSEGPRVQAFDTRTGRLRWLQTTFDTESSAALLAVDGRGNVYLPTSEQAPDIVLVSRAGDGALRWRMPLPRGYNLRTVGVLGGQLVLGGVVIYQTGRETTMLRFMNPATGRTVGSQTERPVTLFYPSCGCSLGSQWTSAVALAPGLVVMNDREGGNGQLAAFAVPQLTGRSR